ncbi:hypothetical protein JTE90_021150 [Oedothorax gibbosus]|uniref:Uncharacterized protein n=1 Tax=Oedothorax gibbosus TaxID=931172 RepID=A0AAV6U085_9ARAC|nr:hypothetical protein JTE90_021150 [Oedothorax gibbosus]
MLPKRTLAVDQSENVRELKCILHLDSISDDVSSEEEEPKSSYIPPPKPPASPEVNGIEALTLHLPFPSEGFQQLPSVTVQQLPHDLSFVTETSKRKGTPSQSLGRPVALEEEDTSGWE